MTNNTLTAVPGVRVGHATDVQGITGCTVVLCPPNTIGGVDQRGGAPGTRETDLLRPMHLVQSPTAILLSGGSAFGLAAADGVMRWCESHGLGYPTPIGIKVPIVPAAILFDLALGDPTARPDAATGYAACEAANDAPVEQGNVGAGTGCSIGKLKGNDFATKAGVGSAAITLANGIVVAALIAVNAVGDVINGDGSILGGLREAPNSTTFTGVLNAMLEAMQPESGGNTVIGVVATNARLTNEQANKVAQMAHDGIARAVHPSHTLYDGDTLFALATGEKEADVNLIGALAADVTAEAIRNGVLAATSLGGVLAWNEQP